jgi:hypothetical protein
LSQGAFDEAIGPAGIPRSHLRVFEALVRAAEGRARDAAEAA